MNPIKESFDRDGVVQLACGKHPYSADDVDKLVGLSMRLSRPDGLGEENKVTVGRIVVDPVDVIREDLGADPPTVDDPELAEEILQVIGSPTALRFFGDTFDLHPATLRRAQTNFLHEGGEVGFHNDHESNPDYRVSVVLGLTDDYTGGEFMAEVVPGEIRRYRLNRSDILITKPEIRHAVDRVHKGVRMSLVMFMA